MKEKDMEQPNSLGDYHRDIVAAHPCSNKYYVTLTLSCGHSKEMSRQGYNKYKDHATLCMQCSTKKRGKKMAVNSYAFLVETVGPGIANEIMGPATIAMSNWFDEHGHKSQEELMALAPQWEALLDEVQKGVLQRMQEAGIDPEEFKLIFLGRQD